MNANAKSIATVFAILAMTVLATGCKSWKTPKMFSLDNTWPFRDKDEPREGVPVRIVGMWTDTVYTQAGQKPQRGFGGRLLFYETDNKDPIIVDGQLVVYAFNETDRDPTDNKPTRRYVFPAEQIPLHMSKSELGTSYSFWLPWGRPPAASSPANKRDICCRGRSGRAAPRRRARISRPRYLKAFPRSRRARRSKACKQTATPIAKRSWPITKCQSTNRQRRAT
jgi:hypothetical protein